MSGQSKESIFDRYSKRRQPSDDTGESPVSGRPAEDAMAAAPPPEPPVQQVSDEGNEVVQGGVYKAAFVFKTKQRQRLRLHYGDGVKVRVLSYAYLIEIVATSHQWLTLVFSNTIVTLKGRNLHTLLDPLQDEQVRALVCFRPGIHPTPASHEACILEIQEHHVHSMAGETGD